MPGQKSLHRSHISLSRAVCRAERPASHCPKCRLGRIILSKANLFDPNAVGNPCQKDQWHLASAELGTKAISEHLDRCSPQTDRPFSDAPCKAEFACASAASPAGQQCKFNLAPSTCRIPASRTGSPHWRKPKTECTLFFARGKTQYRLLTFLTGLVLP